MFILLGLLAGWITGFPRWSYAYVGYGTIYALYLSSVATPGLQFLGYAFAQNQHWGWRAWVGLAAVTILGLLITRSLRPLRGLFAGGWRDWTRWSLALYGVLPLSLWILFDEVHRPYPAPFLAVATVCLAAGALVHLRSGTRVRRVLGLLAGLTTSWLLCTAGLAAYWHGPRVPGLAPFHWSQTALPMALAGVVVVLILLSPVILGLLRRAVDARHAA